MIKAFISTTEKGKIGANGYFDFPTTAEKLAGEMEKCGIDPGKCKVVTLYGGENILNHTFPPPDMFSLDDLQYIGAKLNDMTEYEREVFSAVVEQGFGDDEKHRIFDAIQNLHCCTLDERITSHEQLGRNEVQWRTDACGDVLERLSASPDTEDIELAALVDLLQECADYSAVGREIAEQNGQYISSLGLLSVDWEQYHCLEDLTVPKEYHLNIDTLQKPSLLADLAANKASVQGQPQAPPGGKPKTKDPTL